MNRIIAIITLLVFNSTQAKELRLSLEEAESLAVDNSYEIRAAQSDVSVAIKQQAAGKTLLFPRLSFQGSYSYILNLPEAALGGPGTPPVVFGDHNNYSIGPVLSYTFWDSFASMRNLQALEKISEARRHTVSLSKLKVLLDVRLAYFKVQVALEEIKLFEGFLSLAKKQQEDVLKRRRHGAANKIDEIVAERQVAARDGQLLQAQASLALILKDGLVLIGKEANYDVSRPGTKSMKKATIALDLDSFEKSQKMLEQKKTTSVTNEHPQIKIQELLAIATDLNALSQKSKLYPRLDMQISSTLAYPNGPQIINHFQSAIGLSLTVPLYLGDPTWHIVEQKKAEARSIRLRARQIESDLNRDYAKCEELIENLKTQKKLALQDAQLAQEVAHLYDEMYKAGKVLLLAVQTANTEALNAQVNIVRIDGQILQQMAIMLAISAENRV